MLHGIYNRRCRPCPCLAACVLIGVCLLSLKIAGQNDAWTEKNDEDGAHGYHCLNPDDLDRRAGYRHTERHEAGEHYADQAEYPIAPAAWEAGTGRRHTTVLF